MLTASTRFSFSAGHRLQHHEGKCRHLHGHNWMVEVEAASRSGTDSCGRVVDFSEIKKLLKGWVDQHIDHGMILCLDDREAIDAVKMVDGQKVYTMFGPPSAENISRLLLDQAAHMFQGTHVDIVSVRVWETDGSCARASA